MNIFMRIKNNVEYAYYRKLRDKAIVKMQKHITDADDACFKKWAKIACKSIEKCFEIPLR